VESEELLAAIILHDGYYTKSTRMNLLRKWFWPRSDRNESMSSYKEGLECAERGDTKGAMEAYNLAIERANAPDDVKAMALYNRALLFAANGNSEKALADLQAVMNMPVLLRDIKLAARRRIERLQHRREAADRANRPATS
jgi:tetratricopeptide (TPR) repeat protein